MDFQERKKQFLLLQVNDALFPIGAYSHSYGLETYIQKNQVVTLEDAWEFIYRRMRYGFCYNEFLSARLAYEYGVAGDLEQILCLEDTLDASRIPREIREAGRKLGSRFVKTVRGMAIPYESDIFLRYCAYPEQPESPCSSGLSCSRQRLRQKITHSVVYGVFCAAAGISYEAAMESFLYAQTSSMVTNCVKTIPLSQTDGQHLLYQSQELYQEILETLEQLTINDLCLSTPGFDIRCMRHEGLYSRIYMS
ncbi:MAG: urease accessory protein UreF [Clostridiales bacterium]|nr:urease accessory protein UreF [Clostridiales bacterium]